MRGLRGPGLARIGRLKVGLTVRLFNINIKPGGAEYGFVLVRNGLVRGCLSYYTVVQQ